MASTLFQCSRCSIRNARRQRLSRTRTCCVDNHDYCQGNRGRRRTILSSFVLPLLAVAPSGTMFSHDRISFPDGVVKESRAAEIDSASRYESMPALAGKDYGKARVVYPDFTLSTSGIQYKDLLSGSGEVTVTDGSRVVVDWSGYTIGYYGRIFETRNRSKGGSFTGDEKEYFRFTVGDPKSRVIPAFEEAVVGMKVGGIRRVVVPVENGYSISGSGSSERTFDEPKPNTFSGKRSLDFVLKNQGLIDKTLLFDIEIISIR